MCNALQRDTKLGEWARNTMEEAETQTEQGDLEDEDTFVVDAGKEKAKLMKLAQDNDCPGLVALVKQRSNDLKACLQQVDQAQQEAISYKRPPGSSTVAHC